MLSSVRDRDGSQVDDAPEVAKKMLGQVLVTKQTGAEVRRSAFCGRTRLYLVGALPVRLPSVVPFGSLAEARRVPGCCPSLLVARNCTCSLACG